MSFACRISKLRMRCAWFSLANSGDCSPSSMSQIHRIHSDANDFRSRNHRAEEAVEGGHIHCILEAVVGKKKCVEFLDLPIAQRSGFNRSHRQSHLITTTCRKITRLLDGNSAGARPASRGIAWFARDEFPHPGETARHYLSPDDFVQHGNA